MPETRVSGGQVETVWWIDPAGAILISVYIICSWAFILRNQARPQRHLPRSCC